MLPTILSAWAVTVTYQTPPESDDVDRCIGKRSTRNVNSRTSKRRRIVDSDSDTGMHSGCIYTVCQIFLFVSVDLLGTETE